MLESNFITEHKEIVKLGARKRHVTVDIDKLVELEAKRKKGDKTVMKQWQKLMLQVPNIPSMFVPDGKSSKDNKEVKIERDENAEADSTEMPELFKYFNVARQETTSIISKRDIVAAAYEGDSEGIVHISDSQMMSPSTAIVLYNALSERGISNDEGGHAALSNVFAYGKDDTIVERQEFAALFLIAPLHQASVEAYAKRVQQVGDLFANQQIQVKQYDVCSGQLALSEVAATIFTLQGTVVGRVAYHHDFLARRNGLKRDGALAHTALVELSITKIKNAIKKSN